MYSQLYSVFVFPELRNKNHTHSLSLSLSTRRLKRRRRIRFIFPQAWPWRLLTPSTRPASLRLPPQQPRLRSSLFQQNLKWALLLLPPPPPHVHLSIILTIFMQLLFCFFLFFSAELFPRNQPSRETTSSSWWSWKQEQSTDPATHGKRNHGIPS